MYLLNYSLDNLSLMALIDKNQGWFGPTMPTQGISYGNPTSAEARLSLAVLRIKTLPTLRLEGL